MSKLVKFLAAATGMLASDIRSIITQAPVSYKRYTIPKRTGGRRQIAQPAREVKALQRLLVDRLQHLPIHAAATAYRSDLSIRDNAERHCRNGPIMKFDFENFFPSLRDHDWRAYCISHSVFSEDEDIDLSSRLFFTKIPGRSVLRLAIGAPSSPWLSNVLLFDFDAAITQTVARDQVTYSRYADDLTFSARRTGYLTRVEKDLRGVLSRMHYPRLRLNDEKMVVATKKYRRVVTGLVLANDGRVTIGRDRKRQLRAALHNASQGRLIAEEREKLAGLLAYVKSVEPEYFYEVTKVYGEDIIAKLCAKR